LYFLRRDISYRISDIRRREGGDQRSAISDREAREDTVEGAEERGVKRKERRRGTITQSSQRTEHRDHREERGRDKRGRGNPRPRYKTGTWGTRLVVFLGRRKEKERIRKDNAEARSSQRSAEVKQRREKRRKEKKEKEKEEAGVGRGL